MDPLSITAALLAVIQITNTTANITLRIIRSPETLKDDRYKELYWRLFAERESMEALVTRIEASGQPLSPDNVKHFKSLLLQLHELHVKMDRKLQLLLPKSNQSTVRTLMYRIRFDSGWFEELKQTMNTIESMTRALKILGETLPSYTPPPEGQSASAPRNAQPGEAVAMSQPQDQSGSLSDTMEAAETSSSSRPRGPSTTLASLCRLCEEAMLELCTNPLVQKRGLKLLLARLELWSFGVLHTKDRPLDLLLETDPERYKVMRQFVTKNLVHLGVALATIFRVLDNAEESNKQRLPSRSRTKLLAALGSEQFVEYSAARWEVLSESYESEDEEDHAETARSKGAVDDNTTEADTPAAQLLRKVERMLESTLEDVQIILDSLFSVNPALRSMRQSYRLDLEFVPEEQALSTASTLVVTEPPASRPLPEKKKETIKFQLVSKDKEAQRFMMEESSRLAGILERALRNDEAEAAKSEDPQATRSVPVLSPEMKKYRVKMDKLKDIKTPMPPEKVAVAMELNRTLRSTVDAVMFPEDEQLVASAKWETKSKEEADKVLERALERIGGGVETLSH
ncbi:hypothetical protein VTK73DRAFT_6007 [Phialemonium thermophilum]|uniref:Uncharacterized protein n=1 Tax=Phialemonium thermophilum TaxID=223376 RepID=A0ABR3WKU7_9PEZI